MIRKLIKFIMRQQRASAYLKRIYDEVRVDVREMPGPVTTVAEADPIRCRPSQWEGQRLNLLVPALSVQHVFGGISTAIDFFLQISEGLGNLRIILTDQHEFRHEDNPSFSDWKIGTLDDEDTAGRWIVPAGNRYGRSLPIGLGDRFVATAWWTAISARAIQSWQSSHFSFSSPAKFVYLIQDFEPCFYPWSSRYALAESTYHQTDDLVAVFNTSLLKRFFDDEGYHFASYHTFEPHLNRRLLATRSSSLTQPREQRVLVYGRPGVARNAFEIIVMGLRLWVSQHRNTDWTFVSAGEPHAPIDLGHGKMLSSLGKLSLDEYASELGRCRIGISLMISPHPSYPPLEMAAYGMRVITNRYKTKNLSLLSNLILSIETVSPDAIAQAIDELTNASIMSEIDISTGDYLWRSYLEGSSDFAEMRIQILKRLF